jgi:hypothetical protein
MRTVRIISRILFVIAIVVTGVMLLAHHAFYASTSAFDSLYLPTKASMQAHANQLATHFVHRLSEAPMPLLINELGADSSFKRIGEPFGYSYLASADLPERYPVRWSSTEGWLSDTPEHHKERFLRMLDGMAELNAREPRESISMHSVLLPFSSDPDSITLAGQWTYTESGTSFSGAITLGFYEHYVHRWFLEYRKSGVNGLLDNYMWRAAEFRIAFHDSTAAPIILRAGQSVDMVQVMEDSGDIPDSDEDAEQANVMTRWMNEQMLAEPGWQDDAEWQEARIGTYQTKVQVASPFQMDSLVESFSITAGRWAIGLILLCLLLGIVSWAPLKR